MKRAAPLCSLSLALVVGCAHSRVDDPPLAMELDASGLKEAERELLRDEVCALEGVTDCAMEHKKGTTTVRFVYRGSLGNLRYRIAALPHPGLNPKAAHARLEYEGFDNLAPTITPVDPVPGVVLTYDRVSFRVEVPDADTAEVVIGEQKATKDGAAWQAVLELPDGESQVRVTARDEAGNERELFMPVVIDTTPPTLEVTVTAGEGDVTLVEGQIESGATVAVDGRPVDVDLFGKFRAEVRRDPDKRSVTVTAKDKHGNEASQRRSLKDGRVLD